MKLRICRFHPARHPIFLPLQLCWYWWRKRAFSGYGFKQFAGGFRSWRGTFHVGLGSRSWSQLILQISPARDFPNSFSWELGPVMERNIQFSLRTIGALDSACIVHALVIGQFHHAVMMINRRLHDNTETQNIGFTFIDQRIGEFFILQKKLFRNTENFQLKRHDT